MLISENEKMKKKTNEIVMDKKLDTVDKILMLIRNSTAQIRKINDKWYHDLELHDIDFKKCLAKNSNDSSKRIAQTLIKQGINEHLIENYPAGLIVDSTRILIRNLFSHEYITNSKYSIETIFTFISNLFMSGVLTSKGKMKIKNNKKKSIDGKI